MIKRRYKILAFDLDGTLAESKCAISADMGAALAKLSQRYTLGIISGGDYSQYVSCVISQLPQDTALENLYLLPTSGGKVFTYANHRWQQIFVAELTLDQKKLILDVVDKSGILELYNPPEIFGEVIEDRDTQFTISFLGQQAPVEIKKHWDPDKLKRKQAVDILTPLLPDFDVRYGGSTSVEVANKRIDKAFGIQKLLEITNYTKEDIIFFGDSLEQGGNDYSILELGIDCLAVKDPSETLQHLQALL